MPTPGFTLLAVKDAAGNTKQLRVWDSVGDGSAGYDTVTDLASLAGVALDVGAGVKSAGTQRVTLATDDTLLAAIKLDVDKIPAQGQALAAASLPVVLTAAQLATLTPVSTVAISGTVAVSGTFWQATQPISAASLPLPSGAATSANQATEITGLAAIVTALGAPFQVGGSIGNTTFTVTQASGTNLHTVIDSGTITTVTTVTTVAAVTAITNALPAGTNAIGSVKDNGPAWTSVFGVSGEVATSANASATPLVITDAPTSGQKICLDDIVISVDTAMSVIVRTTTGVKKIYKLYMDANDKVQITTRGRIKAPTADQTLEILTSVSGNVTCTAAYHSEA